MAELRNNTLQGPFLSLRIQREGDGGSGAQGTEEELVGIRAEVIAGVGRLVGHEGVVEGGDDLLEVSERLDSYGVHGY